MLILIILLLLLFGGGGGYYGHRRWGPGGGAGIGLAVGGYHQEIVGGATGAGHEGGLRQLRGAHRIDRLRRHDRSVDDEVSAVRRRIAVIERVIQRVAVFIGGAEQARGLQHLARARRDAGRPYRHNPGTGSARLCAA